MVLRVITVEFPDYETFLGDGKINSMRYYLSLKFKYGLLGRN